MRKPRKFAVQMNSNSPLSSEIMCQSLRYALSEGMTGSAKTLVIFTSSNGKLNVIEVLDTRKNQRLQRFTLDPIEFERRRRVEKRFLKS
jgi:hypothetical protein